MKLYLRDFKLTKNAMLSYYLTSGTMQDQPGPIYFRVGRKDLFHDYPTYFETKELAIQAGKDAGFEVSE